MTDLGLLENGERAHAYGITSDGATIVGTANSNGRNQGFIWREEFGMRRIEKYLLTEGILSTLDDWNLTTIDAISANGRFLVGRGYNPNGGFGGYFIDLNSNAVPEPGTGSLLGMLGAIVMLRRRRKSLY